MITITITGKTIIIILLIISFMKIIYDMMKYVKYVRDDYGFDIITTTYDAIVLIMTIIYINLEQL